MNSPRLVSIQVGLPREYGEEGAADPMARLWATGFFKEPVSGPVRLGVVNLEGDGQADLKHHGGPDKAVLAYAAAHYEAWRSELNRPDLPHGAFGENFTIAGLSEADVCIGDVWTIGGEVVVQVSQPRQPCWKLSRRWRIRTLSADVQRNGRTGWYFRVVAEGIVEAGMPLVLQERPHPEWSIARGNRLMHHEKDDLPAAAELAAVPLLSSNWQATLRGRVEKRSATDPAKRLFGEEK